MLPGTSLRTIVPQSDRPSVGYTHASKVTPLLRSRESESLTVTKSEPLKERALPFLAVVVRAAPVIVPALPLPETSATTLPLLSLKEYAATGPAEGGSALLTVTEIIFVFLFPARSRATA